VASFGDRDPAGGALQLPKAALPPAEPRGEVGISARRRQLGEVREEEADVSRLEHRSAERLVSLQQEIGGAAQMRELAAGTLRRRLAVQVVGRGQAGELAEHLARGGGAPRQHLGRLAAQPRREPVPVPCQVAAHPVELAQRTVLGGEQPVVAHR
jgi:hypothetical protein